MSTNTVGIQDLYAEIVADLAPFYADATLIDNEALIIQRYDIAGQSGNTLRIPVTNAYVVGGTVDEGNSITAAATSDLNPSNVTITMAKRGVGTDVTQEAIEDGGMDTVKNAVLTRLSRGLALATDDAGWVQCNTSFTTQTGNASLTGANSVVNFVFSPMALGMAKKRLPTVNMWFDPDTDKTEFRASVRNGFTAVYPTFGVRMNDDSRIGSATLTLDEVAKAVAELRSVNAVEGSDGLFVSVIAPSSEYSIASQLNSVTQAAIGSLSDIGNRALLTGLIGQAGGVTFYRSNRLPQG
jgi:hypothetical protein